MSHTALSGEDMLRRVSLGGEECVGTIMLRRMICSVQVLKKQCDAKGLVLAAIKAGDFTLRLKWASIKRVARASVNIRHLFINCRMYLLLKLHTRPMNYNPVPLLTACSCHRRLPP